MNVLGERRRSDAEGRESPNCGKACRAAPCWFAGAVLANRVDNKIKPKDCVLAVCAPKQI